MANLKNISNSNFYGLPYPDANDATKFKDNINKLYEKINNCTRSLSYFDLYKITTVVNQASELQAQINALTPYTSLIINTPILIGDGTRYNIGDLVVKNNDGTYEIIEAQRGGIFYPASITKHDGSSGGCSYDINFKYQRSAPHDGSNTIEGNNGVGDASAADKYTTDITFSNISSDYGESPYNEVKEISADSQLGFSIVAAKTKETRLRIDPIVYAYQYVGNDQTLVEQVYVDQSIKYDSTKNEYNISLCGNKDIVQRVVIK